jgi:parallel beta-helix repeat protein
VASSVISDNLVYLPPARGTWGIGILSDDFLSDVSISDNVFSGLSLPVFIKRSYATVPGSTGASIFADSNMNAFGKKKVPISVSIKGNTCSYAPQTSTGIWEVYGVLLLSVHDAVITDNKFNIIVKGAIPCRGIALGSDVSGTLVKGNTISMVTDIPATPTSQISGGIHVNGNTSGSPYEPPNRNNLLQNNTISGNSPYGLVLVNTTENVVQGNIVNNGGVVGIQLDNADNNILTRNISSNHSYAGLRVLETTENNRIERNTFLGNGQVDIEDNSSGGNGTSGTSNYYTRNTVGTTNF